MLEEVKTIKTSENIVMTCVYVFRDVRVTLITIYNPPATGSYKVECYQHFETIDSLIVRIDEFVVQKGKENGLIVNDHVNFCNTNCDHQASSDLSEKLLLQNLLNSI